MATPSVWLVKSEPSVYAFARLLDDRKTMWEGVRNFEARNNLRAMKKGETVLFFHTGKEKAVVGLAKVARAPEPDPTAPGEDYSAIVLEAHKRLAVPVTLATLKATPATRDISVVKMGRLSVGALTDLQLSAVLTLAKTRP